MPQHDLCYKYMSKCGFYFKEPSHTGAIKTKIQPDIT